MPVAAATAVTPPLPSPVASAAAHNRRIRSFAVTMLSSPSDERPGHTVHWDARPLTGTVADHAGNHATVRLIRVPS